MRVRIAHAGLKAGATPSEVTIQELWLSDGGNYKRNLGRWRQRNYKHRRQPEKSRVTESFGGCAHQQVWRQMMSTPIFDNGSV